MRHQALPKNDESLLCRLKELAERYSRYGYLLLHGLLRNEGLVCNKKRTYRLYTDMGLQVRTRRRKKLIWPRVPLALPDRFGERWSIDFVYDQLSCGRRFRVLNVVDDFSRECIGQLVDTSITGVRLARYQKWIPKTGHGAKWFSLPSSSSGQR